MSHPTVMLVGGTYRTEFQVYDPSNPGQGKAPDSLPTASVTKNGTATGDSVTIVAAAGAATGHYKLSYTPAGAVSGDTYVIRVTSLISSVPYPELITFTVLPVTFDANVVAMANGVLTPEAIAANALNGKGDWNTTVPPTVVEMRQELDTNSTKLDVSVSEAVAAAASAASSAAAAVVSLDAVVNAIVGLYDLSPEQAQAAALAALVEYGPPTKAEMDARTRLADEYATADSQTALSESILAIPQSITDDHGAGSYVGSTPEQLREEMESVDSVLGQLWNMTEDHDGNRRFTAVALGAATASAIIDVNQMDALFDAIRDASVKGAGDQMYKYRITESDGTPVPQATVWITLDAFGYRVVAGALPADDKGDIICRLTPGAVYYLWAKRAGWRGINGARFKAGED